MSANRAQSKVERKRKLINRKRRIQYRLRDRSWTDQAKPLFTARNIQYELADRARGLGATEEEIAETVQVAYLFGGWSALFPALNAFEPVQL